MIAIRFVALSILKKSTNTPKKQKHPSFMSIFVVAVIYHAFEGGGVVIAEKVSGVEVKRTVTVGAVNECLQSYHESIKRCGNGPFIFFEDVETNFAVLIFNIRMKNLRHKAYTRGLHWVVCRQLDINLICLTKVNRVAFHKLQETHPTHQIS